MAKSITETGDRVHIVDNKDALTLNEVASLLNMSDADKQKILNPDGSGDVPEDWEGDVTDEDILKLIEQDTSAGATDD